MAIDLFIRFLTLDVFTTILDKVGSCALTKNAIVQPTLKDKLILIKSTLSQIHPHWNWNSKLNAKLSLGFQFEYGFKLEFQVELLII